MNKKSLAEHNANYHGIEGNTKIFRVACFLCKEIIEAGTYKELQKFLKIHDKYHKWFRR